MPPFCDLASRGELTLSSLCEHVHELVKGVSDEVETVTGTLTRVIEINGTLFLADKDQKQVAVVSFPNAQEPRGPALYYSVSVSFHQVVPAI